jgi:hypothetical protein
LYYRKFLQSWKKWLKGMKSLKNEGDWKVEMTDHVGVAVAVAEALEVAEEEEDVIVILPSAISLGEFLEVDHEVGTANVFSYTCTIVKT